MTQNLMSMWLYSKWEIRFIIIGSLQVLFKLLESIIWSKHRILFDLDFNRSGNHGNAQLRSPFKKERAMPVGKKQTGHLGTSL